MSNSKGEQFDNVEHRHPTQDEQLRESAARLMFALESAQIGDWDLDLTTQTARRSLRHDQIFGYESLLPSWSYEVFLEHVHPEDREAVDEKFKHTLSSGEPWFFECRIIWSDKSVHWIWARGCIYHDSTGKPVRILGLVGDITERKKAEEERRTLYERLREIDELKTQFFANVSHELRTPLALILGPTEKLLLDDRLHEHRGDLEVVGRNARLLLKHVNDLLEVSKLEAGKMKASYADVDLSRLVRFVASHFDSLAQERRMIYSVEAPPSLTAQVDPEKIERVVLNLLSNAFKFTPDLGRVRASVSIASDHPGHAIIAVGDSGPGVPVDLRGAIFERFRQGEGGSTRRFGGTGLGLAIARDFVLLHGGTIHVGDAPEGGALFTVAIPLTVPKGVEIHASAPTAVAHEVARQAVEELRTRSRVEDAKPNGEKALVLVVEDNPEMARFLAETLAAHYRVVTAMDGEQGLRKVVELKPDLVLTDVMMPRMSGDQLVREIRKHPELDNVAVVLLTAKADEELRVRTLREGAQDYLLKPFSVDELQARVGNLVAIKRTREVLQKESEGQLRDLETLAGEVVARKRELETALATAHEARSRVTLLNHIARAIASRHDLYSIFHVVLRYLENDFPMDVGAVYLCDVQSGNMTVAARGAKSQALGAEMGLPEGSVVPVSQAGFEPCLRGEQVCVSDTAQATAPIPNGFARKGIRSYVASPLVVDSKALGILIVGRHRVDGFSKGDQDFLKALSEHVALAVEQARLHTDLKTAYDELQRTQQQIIRQERLRALGQMASGIAHDFNNALGPILGFSELLLDRPTDLAKQEIATKYLKFINTAAKDGARVVSRLKEFYRHREGNEVFEPVDLNQVVEQTVSLTEPRWKDQAQAVGVAIRIENVLPKTTRFPGNGSDLRELLTNLVFNAVDAMPKGGTITMRTRQEKEHVVLEVSDNGTGMTEEVQRRCLEPFFTTKGEKGTGLGLAMVHGIVRRHEGTLEIQSEIGKGTTFILRFPLESSAQLKSGACETGTTSRPLRALVVEDQPEMRGLVEAYLARDGHAVETAKNGREALAKFTAGRFNLVVTDRAMPEMSGDQLAIAIKVLEPTMPIILLTGFGELMNASGEHAEGVDMILSKPVTLAALREAVAKVLPRQK